MIAIVVMAVIVVMKVLIVALEISENQGCALAWIRLGFLWLILIAFSPQK